MPHMKSTDRLVLTVVHASGLHEKTSYHEHERFRAAMEALRQSKLPGVVRTSVDLVRNYKAPRMIRVWV